MTFYKIIMFSFFISLEAFAACPKMYGRAGVGDDGRTFLNFSDVEVFGSVPVDEEAMDSKCRVDTDIVKLEANKISVDPAKKLAREQQEAVEKVELEKRKVILSKIKNGELSTNEDVKAALQVLMDASPSLKEDLKEKKPDGVLGRKK